MSFDTDCSHPVPALGTIRWRRRFKSAVIGLGHVHVQSTSIVRKPYRIAATADRMACPDYPKAGIPVVGASDSIISPGKIAVLIQIKFATRLVPFGLRHDPAPKSRSREIGVHLWQERGLPGWPGARRVRTRGR